MCKTYRVILSAEAPALTDHRLVVSTMPIRFQALVKHRPTPRHDVAHLRNDNLLASKFTHAVRNSIATDTSLPNHPEAAWPLIRDAMKSAANDLLLMKHHKRKAWLTDKPFVLYVRSPPSW